MKLSLEKEKELLERAKLDKKKFDEIYKYFVNDVYRFTYSILNNQHDAEDITSQTFILFYKKIDSYGWQGLSMKHWLFRTSRNMCLKKMRDTKSVNLDKDLDDLIEDEYEISFVDQIINLELVELVKEEIQNLKPIEREAINLRLWEGFAFKEIAVLQNSTESSAKKRFYRSIEKVKKAFESKGIRSLVALPMLFTAVKQVGATPAYAAPIRLINKFDGNKNLFNPNLTQNSISNLQNILVSKTGIVLTIGLVSISAVGGVAAYRGNYKNAETQINQPSENIAEKPTLTITPTTVPTTESKVNKPVAINAQPTPTFQHTILDTTLWNEYVLPDNDQFGNYSVKEFQIQDGPDALDETDEYMKFSLKYPSDYVINFSSLYGPNNIKFADVGKVIILKENQRCLDDERKIGDSEPSIDTTTTLLSREEFDAGKYSGTELISESSFGFKYIRTYCIYVEGNKGFIMSFFVSSLNETDTQIIRTMLDSVEFIN